VGTFSAIPISIQFPENYDDDFMSDQVGRLLAPQSGAKNNSKKILTP
jgi:hypothetical protein